MKISILTPTYNRGKLLKNVYQSLLENATYGAEIEWLIMNDGSKDHTKDLVQKWKEENKIKIQYYEQENQGKMAAINELMKHVTGDLVVDCDSDDYFTKDAFRIIKKACEKNKEVEGIYGFCFLKQDSKGNNIRKKLFENENDHV